jgi:hypothetical protein
MVDKLHVRRGPTTAELESEIVERKGLEHRDTNRGSRFTYGFLF